MESGESVLKINCLAATNTLAWHPSKYLLAFAGDDVDSKGQDCGNLKILGL